MNNAANWSTRSPLYTTQQIADLTGISKESIRRCLRRTGASDDGTALPPLAGRNLGRNIGWRVREDDLNNWLTLLEEYEPAS